MAGVSTVDEFVHLHLHTQYSLLDGAIRVPELIARCKEFGMKTVAVTDHGNMFGAIEFYDYAKKNELKPIVGVEAYIAPGSRLDKKGRADESANHLTLLAMDHTGYKNLCRLVSQAYLEGFHYKPRMDKELLAKHHEGIFCLSGCLKGEVAQKFVNGDDAGAIAAAKWYQDLFGKEFYALEVMENGLDEQRLVNEKLFALAKEIDAPVVATGDCHYLRKEDASPHDALLCIGTGKLLSEPNRMKFNNDGYYLKSSSEMAKEWRHYPEAVKNSMAVAEKAHLKFDFGKYHFPIYPGSKEPGAPTLDETMAHQAREGLGARMPVIRQFWKVRKPGKGEVLPLPEELDDLYGKRLEYEIGVIQKMGFSGYLLIVADFINWAKQNGIPVGPGRGSAAGSLVCYAMKITDIDPIPYNLLFERFLNPERVSMPDIDVDFCINGRGRVIEYVNGRYGGSEFVSQIITFGQMKAKAVIRDIGRVMGLSFADTDRIAKLVPNTLNITLDQAMEQAPALRELASKDATVNQVIQMAKGLEGLTRHASVHAAGVVISDLPLTDYLPLFRGKEGETVTQFDMKWVEKVGLIKFDFLGLKNLTMIEDAVRRIHKGKNVEIHIDQLPMDDDKVYALLASGDADGIFQLESSGMRELLSKLKPTVFEDIAALVALYRPGPLQSGMVDDFIKRKHGKTKVEYPLPQLETILKDTYGVIVYQEQVMQIASELAGYSLGDADLLRRAMGKKKAEEMAAQRDRFMKGAAAKSIDPKKAGEIFDLMEKFAGYGFNRAHSAAYALVSYQTAYLKTHFPAEFMAALLTIDSGNSDKVMLYVNSCRDRGIPVLPPDVNESGRTFEVRTAKDGKDEIRFGLAAVKNVGEGAIEAILEARERLDGKRFKTLSTFSAEVDPKRVNKRVVESLIKCGAFSTLDKTPTRASLLAGLDAATEHGSRTADEKASGQTSLFGGFGGAPAVDKEPELPRVPEFPEKERLAFEKEALGFYITGHPLQAYSSELKRYTSGPIATLSEKTDGVTVKVAGIVASLKEIKTKKGDLMAFITVEDLTGTTEVTVFPSLYASVSVMLKSDDPVLVTGTLEKGEEAAPEPGAEEPAEGDKPKGNMRSNAAKILAEEIKSLAEVRAKSTREVHVTLREDDLTPELLAKMRDAIQKASAGGNGSARCPVTLHVMKRDRYEAILPLPDHLKVPASDDVLTEFEKIFGRPVAQFR